MVLNLSNLRRTLSTIDGERGIRIPDQIFMDEERGLKKIHHKPVTTLGAEAYGRFQFKIWLEKSRNGNLSCMGAPGRRS
jgi:hypothetical protein